MKKKTFLFAAASLLLLAGCESDTTGTPEQDLRTPLAISAGVNTRAEGATWHANDAIGVYTLASGTATVYDAQANLKYINTAGQGATATFDPADAQNTAYFPADGSEVDVIAYYPHGEQLSIVNCQLSIDVSSQSSLPAIDLMTSALALGHSAGDSDVKLEFRHRLAKLAMVIKTDESTAHIDPSAAAITLHGTATKGVYNLTEQKIASATDVADIRLASRTAIVMPTVAGSGVTFTVTAGDKDFTATLPDGIALPAGKVTTVTITLMEKNAEPVPAAIEATITDWEGGPTAEVDAIRLTTPTNPETGVPTVTRFNLWKNDDQANAAYYEYTNGKWSATPAFFLVEDVKDGDVFNARFTPADEAADAITGIKDIIEAGPAAMNAEGIIDLTFSHINSLLAITLTKGEGIPAEVDMATAKIEILGHSFDGATTGDHIYQPATIKAGSIIAKVTLAGHTYEAISDKDFVLAAGTRNKLAITLSVETQGKRTAAMNVTTKDWAVGMDGSVDAIRFTTPTNPTTGEPSIKEFTVMKNGAEPTVYEYAAGTWTATPAFFLVEDTEATDVFTATFTSEVDEISGLADELVAGPATMNNDGIINLEFAHTLAKLNIRVFADFTDAAVLPNAKVTYAGFTYTGADKTFIINPAAFKAGDVVATVVLEGYTYEAKATKDIDFAAGTTNTLAITLKVEEQGKRTAAMNVTTKDWAVGMDEAMDAIRFTTPTNPTTGEPSIKEFTVMKNGAEPTIYTYSNGEWSASPAFFLVEDTEATDVFTATFTGEVDEISGLADELVAGPATMNAQGIIDLEFSHTKATLTVRVYKGDGATGDVSTAKVSYQGIDFTGAENTFIIEPKNFAKDDVMAIVNLDGHDYEVVADKAINFAAGTTNALAITLKVEVQGNRNVGLNVTTKDWVAGTNADAAGTRVVMVVGPGDGNTEVNEFTLYKNMGAQDEASVVYKLNAAGNAYEPKGGGAPFYMEDVRAGDLFIGQYSLGVDAITGMDDIMQTAAVAMTNEGMINLTFAHINAKLTLNLVPGTAFSGNLDNAVVKLLAYTQTATGASNTFIMEPNTYAAGAEIATITLAGITYKVALSADMELVEGEHTVLTATLAPTAVNLSVAVVGWADGAPATAQTEVTVSDITGLPATPGTLTLASAGLTATYAWDGTSLTANGNSLYWEDLYTGAATYNFELTFTPTAKDAVTDVKDILNGTAEAAYNVAPQFDLAHINARLLVKLVKGTNFPEAIDLETAEVKLLDYTKTATGKDTEFLMEPKTIAKDTKIVTVTLADMTYTAKLNADMTLSAGKATTLTLTLNPTGVNMNVNVTNWADGGSTGGDLELE